MAIATMALVGMAMGGAKGFMGMQNNKRAAAQAMKQRGMQQAQKEMQATLAQARLIGEAYKVQQGKQSAELQIQMNAMKNEASLEVNAAAAGVKGGSVDVTQNEIHESAGRARASVDQKAINAYEQINQSSRDIVAETAMAQTEAPELDNRGAMVNMFSSALTGYLGAR